MRLVRRRQRTPKLRSAENRKSDAQVRLYLEPETSPAHIPIDAALVLVLRFLADFGYMNSRDVLAAESGVSLSEVPKRGLTISQTAILI